MKMDLTVVLLMTLITMSILLSTVRAKDDHVVGVEISLAARVQEQGERSRKSDDGCLRQLSSLLNDPVGSQRIALNSFGIPNTGLLSGNNGWYGHFDACTELATFKYCMLTTNVNAVTLPEGTNAYHRSLRWGVCVPEICSTGDIRDNVAIFAEHLNSTHHVELRGLSAQTYCVEDIPYTTGFYITIGVFGIVGLLVVLGTLVDVIDDVNSDVSKQDDGAAPERTKLLTDTLDPNESEERNLEEQSKVGGENKKSVLKTTLLAFAINRNLSKLTTVGHGVDIDCLHGIRVMSMLWIVAMHVYVKSETDIDIFNQGEMWRMRGSYIYQMFILNASTAVDTFFFLRLTPILASVIALWVFVSPHTYRGPTIGDFIDRSSCEKHWWADLLYVQNFFTSFLVDQCIVVAWYLSVDMQLYVFSPIIIYLLYRSPTFGIILAFVVQIISFIITGLIVAINNIPAATTAGFMLFGYGYGDVIYTKPYVRLPSYVVGMVVGFMIYKIKETEVISSKIVAVIGWIFALVTAAAVLCITVNHHYMDPSIGKVGDVTYQVLHRFAWGLFLSWVVIYCHYGNSSGWINNILGWKAWVPMSRLTFIVYLTHSLIFRTFLSNIGQSYYTTSLIEIFNTVSLACVSYLCAVFLYLTVELPVANLVQAYLPKL